MIGSKSYKVYGGDIDETYEHKDDAIKRADQLAELDFTGTVWVEETTVIHAVRKNDPINY